MAVGDTYPLGPGTLTIGAIAAAVDVSCLVNNAVLTATKDQGDSVTKLCGTVKVGAISYEYELTGNMDIDPDDPAGIFALSHASPGSEQEFVFTPNTEAGTNATGTLILDPLDLGGDTTGETMTSDFTFSCVGKPLVEIGIGVVAAGTEGNGNGSRKAREETAA